MNMKQHDKVKRFRMLPFGVGRSTSDWLVNAYAIETQIHEIDEADAERRE